MTFDREGLKQWYRGAMHGRLDELRTLRALLRSHDGEPSDAVRAIAQSLRGSGAMYGFPELSAAAGMVELSSEAALLRRVEGLIGLLRILSTEGAQDPGVAAEWLEFGARGALDGEPRMFADMETAWDTLAAENGLDPAELVVRIADYFSLREPAEGAPSRAALRLVPEALIRARDVLPLREAAETITVATADPTSLDLEAELIRLTGRTPIFVVAAPHELRQRIEEVLGHAEGAARPSGTERVPARAPFDEVVDGRVLLVDDDIAQLMLARRLLEKVGYDVHQAGDGAQALRFLEDAQPPALVVADLNMPKLDGLELIWEMRAKDDWARIPVIVVTGETDEILETRLIEEGADDYIRKPLDPRLFLARVAATIRRAEH